MLLDALVVGAGPAGSVAATVLARAGARVCLVDRATFPRPKLCGDTVNPGALALLKRLDMAADLERSGLRVDGMRVTGEGGAVIDAQYPEGLSGRALGRAELDWSLLEAALRAGAEFEPSVTVRSAIVSENARRRVVEGVIADANGVRRSLRARVVIGADGRRSSLAFGLRMARHPESPRRWAIGAYFPGESGLPSYGEMHIRRGRYIGVATIPGGITNVCVVKPADRRGSCDFGDPTALLAREIMNEPLLRDRFGGRRPLGSPTMLGPLAVDVATDRVDGLLLAGDAAGFIDPMTGDGLRFAVKGGELAALAALRALAHGWPGVHDWLHRERRREFAPKWRLNRALRALVGSPAALQAAGVGSRLAPGIIRALVARAADCDVAIADNDRV